MFPLGFYAFFFPEHRQSSGWVVLFGVFALYFIHAIFYFRTRTNRSSLLFLGLLVALLICNVAGCRAMIHAY